MAKAHSSSSDATCVHDRREGALIQIVDAALAEATRKAGPWLVCRLGCTQCCIGPFPISQLDARRLRNGLAELETRDPTRATRVRQRARLSISRISPDFPGDPATGLLAEGEEAEEQFASFADDEPCPALDPDTGACDLYAARPITCRTFGPPVRCGSDAVGVCELCFEGATDDEIAACEVEADIEDVESALLRELEQSTGARGQTIVAFSLITPPVRS
jgi:Fe-S-cluster containining protein